MHIHEGLHSADPWLRSSVPDAVRSPVVSVIVPVHNGEERVPLMLEALERQTAPAYAFEVIVVDDCSTDGTCEVVERSGIASLVRSGRRGGSYAARNLGLRHSSAGLIAFTDSDCVPATDWIAAGLEMMRDPGVDMLAGRVDVTIGERPSIAALVDAWRFLDQERWVRQGFGATANLWVRRETIDRVGPFRIMVSGGDAEFGRRATTAGAALAYGHGVLVRHPPRDRARELARKALRTGVGAAQQRQSPDARLQGRVWVRPQQYVPHDRVRDLDRILAQGYVPTLAERLGMFWMNYFALKLPHAAGDLMGDLLELRRSSVARADADAVAS